MKALSIQPLYATLIALGEKFIELRSWKTDYRGPIVICAGKAQNKAEREGMLNGHAVAVVELEDVRPYVDETDRDLAFLFEDETFEGYSWVFKSVTPIKPIPVKGRLSLFELDIDEQIEYLELEHSPEDYEETMLQYWHENGYIKDRSMWDGE